MKEQTFTRRRLLHPKWTCLTSPVSGLKVVGLEGLNVPSSLALSQKCSGLGHSDLPGRRRQYDEVKNTLESQES